MEKVVIRFLPASIVQTAGEKQVSIFTSRIRSFFNTELISWDMDLGNWGQKQSKLWNLIKFLKGGRDSGENQTFKFACLNWIPHSSEKSLLAQVLAKCVQNVSKQHHRKGFLCIDTIIYNLCYVHLFGIFKHTHALDIKFSANMLTYYRYI